MKNYNNTRFSIIETAIPMGVVILFVIITIYFSWYFIFLFGLIAFGIASLNKRKINFLDAQRNIVRTFILLVIPYFIIKKLLYPIELFPTPFYTVGFLFGASLANINSNIVLGITEIKFETIKQIFLSRKYTPQALAFLIFCSIDVLNHRSTIAGISLSVLSLIVAYLPLKGKEKQIIALAYFSSTVFIFLSMVS
jgi:hypothetical protein